MLLILVFALITVIILGIGIAYWFIDDWHIDGVGFRVIGFIMAIILVAMISSAWYDNAYKELHYTQALERYNSLTYQLENNFYDKFTYDGRAELMGQIYDYNAAVLSGRAKHSSKWIGCWYPMDYDSLPLISLPNT